MSDPQIVQPTSSPTGPRDKDARDSSAGCRDRAAADMLRADDMDTANGRRIFETSAANWTKRADMLHRIETGIEARLTAAAPDMPELTSSEIAEDAAALRDQAPAPRDAVHRP
jgi:hypothetical protein